MHILKTLRAIFAGMFLLVMIPGLLAACKESKEEAAKPEYKPGIAREMANGIVSSRSLEEVSASVMQALALGGIGTADADGWKVEPLQPAAAAFVMPPEAAALAMEARNRAAAGRMTLEELGQMLSELGWPFPEGKSPGEHLVPFFSAWVNYAADHPDDPESFTPAFLAEMALRQNPSIDLAKADCKPADLRFTTLELQLIAGAFDRAVRPPGTGRENPLESAFHWGAGVAYAAEPCSDAKKWLGNVAGKGFQITLTESANVGLKKAMEAAGVPPEDAARMGKALSALNIGPLSIDWTHGIEKITQHNRTFVRIEWV